MSARNRESAQQTLRGPERIWCHKYFLHWARHGIERSVKVTDGARRMNSAPRRICLDRGATLRLEAKIILPKPGCLFFFLYFYCKQPKVDSAVKNGWELTALLRPPCCCSSGIIGLSELMYSRGTLEQHHPPQWCIIYQPDGQSLDTQNLPLRKSSKRKPVCTRLDLLMFNVETNCQVEEAWRQEKKRFDFKLIT